MKFSRFPGITLALAASIALIGCGQKEEPKPQAAAPAPAAAPVTPPPPPPKPEVTVKLGHVAPMTGPQAHLGKDNENGAKLAIEELNAQNLEIGGAKIKFELLAEDDGADPKQGTIVAQKLVDAKVNGVIGHLNSGTTIPASKLYSDAGIPQISPSATNPKYTQQGFKTAFRVMANDIQQGKVLGEFSAKQGAKTVAIVDDRTAYGQGLADEFKKAAEAAGLKVVATEYTNDKATDFKAILTKIKSKKPDLVFYGGMDAQGGPMAKQMKELGLKAKFLGGDGVCTPEFMKLGGAATEGHYCSMPGVPLEKMAKGPAFKETFTKKFNAEIQLYAPNVYDAVMVMADSMKRANSVDPAKYLEAVGKTSYEGVTAKIEFDDKGDLKGGAISIYQYKGGKLEYVETLGGGVVAAVKEAAAATGEAAKAVAGAAADATKDGAKAVTEAAKDGTKAAAEAVKGAADATKAAVEKK
ncbi:MAG: branched-chain amino acid transport system substrate-binding protein [Pseudomonadota bacterium]|nr:branched-chain amino acid transport system substrate-binding protein [Pseudomonadota bacterium]MDQ5917738.1 branched-chain amino acid transport system substrate-binding protein [Pseudomonadota bacterium]MDQ5942497.1 branched-chain amino acid transport system substrate-binding protein [Pseudomonadota bacterium]MDQ5945532.1 branched-chain amino acid transport system substrate-binding protein [Pseudomonadota bacterium]MDQ5960375.1 branched-chain amino acid transport system substrate-binding pro